MQAVIFPGQGAQFKGMGRGLFDKNADVVAIADRVLGYSVEELCLADPNRRLGLTQYTQPALYTVNALAYLDRAAGGNPPPAFFAGHSLGEYNALLAAGVFNFEAGLLLVKKRGELMSQASGGAMAAVLGLDSSRILALCRERGLMEVHTANINSPSQVVISGGEAQITQAHSILEAQEGVRCVRLNVSGAFHSPQMQNAAGEFSEFCKNFEFSRPLVPVISNVTARPHVASDLASLLVRQITSPVQWNDSIRFMIGKGVVAFHEVGVGQVLTKLISQIRQQGTPLIDPEPTQSGASFATGKLGVAAMASQPGGTGEAAIAQATSTVEERTSIGQRSPSRSAAESLPEPMPRPQETAPSSKASEAPPPVARKVQAPLVQSSGARSNSSRLGSASFQKDYRLKYAYLAGSMYKGISSREMVVRMGKAGFLAFLGTGGMRASNIEEDILYIQSELGSDFSYGCNILHSPGAPQLEEETIDILLRRNVRIVEASAYMQVSPALVRYKLRGLGRVSDGSIVRQHRIIAKVSHVEVARAFLSPAPERIVQNLLARGEITAQQADLARQVPIADELCVESDSGGHTDQGVAFALFPSIAGIRDEILTQRNYSQEVRVGAAGGIGTPQAALAAFMLGADFIVTGSINQCTVEANTSEAVKDMLQSISVNDTDYAPAGDMFELGAKVQVVKKGVFFPARANKLYDLYRQHNAIDEISPAIRKQIEEKYFKTTFESVWAETKEYYMRRRPEEIESAERNEKRKMALIFQWYFVRSTRLALTGDVGNRVDFQIQCGPALGAFNQWAVGTPLENWRNRHVDVIALSVMEAAGELLGKVLKRYSPKDEALDRDHYDGLRTQQQLTVG